MTARPTDGGATGPGQAPRQRKPNFGWTAALLIVGSQLLIGAIGMVAIFATFQLPAKFMMSAEVLGYYIGIAIVAGFAVSTLIGVPLLAVLFRAGFGRALLAVCGSILHVVAWGILVMSTPEEIGVILAFILDVVLSAACIVMLRRGRRAMRAAEEKLLSQFD